MDEKTKEVLNELLNTRVLFLRLKWNTKDESFREAMEIAIVEVGRVINRIDSDYALNFDINGMTEVV
jgi:hypothetical protein